MVRLKIWQWLILCLPIATIIGFLLVAASLQIQAWGISWVWAVFTLALVVWRWLLVKWTQPAVAHIEDIVAQVNKELEATVEATPGSETDSTTNQAQVVLKEILLTSQNDVPFWEDWQTFWQRCLDLIVGIARIYHPEVKYPLLNIYVPQAYGLIRGTVDDLDKWMQKLAPALNQATIGQAFQAYEVYQKLEPSARKFMRVWGAAQWLLNPAAAVAKRASQGYSNQANQQLLVNFSQLLREAALTNLCRQAVILYGGNTLPSSFSVSATQQALPSEKTQTLREILAQAEPVETVEQKPVNILLIGRTGAGKSSLINTLFSAELAQVDVLPSTDKIQSYYWENQNTETLTLWDTPGYEQINIPELRQEVLDYTKNADLLLLVTPVLDPSLQIDVDFLKEIKANVTDLPIITVVTQVDKLRPIREWQPPYDWQWGERPKEVSIREGTKYRAQLLGDFSTQILPVVTSDSKTGRTAWGTDALSLALIEAIAPAKKSRLARFLRDLEARTVAAANIIENYTLIMATTKGLTALLKSPILQFLSTISTGSPNLAYLLSEKIPAEQLPVVIGKLQMAYDLFSLLNPNNTNILNFDLQTLWPLLIDNSSSSERNARAFGHALVEYWTKDLTVQQLRERFEYYLISFQS
ncbi:MAG: GTPase family protein [Scytonematopsis contorta HA4267-MV1]|jgi:hypothetical protein|nr:GTPase family protein [Scytonematopsis contorta HA4267-MV1]